MTLTTERYAGVQNFEGAVRQRSLAEKDSIPNWSDTVTHTCIHSNIPITLITILIVIMIMLIKMVKI